MPFNRFFDVIHREAWVPPAAGGQRADKGVRLHTSVTHNIRITED